MATLTSQKIKKTGKDFGKAFGALKATTDRIVELRVAQLTQKNADLRHLNAEEATLKSKRHDLRNSITKKDAAMRARIQLAREFRTARNKARAELETVESKLTDIETRRAAAHQHILEEAKKQVVTETSKLLGSETAA